MRRLTKVIIEMMYLELFVKKYKEAILTNLDVCMKQSLEHLRSGTWDSIRCLRLDTYFSNPDRSEDAKLSIKKIYERQRIDFAQFSSKTSEMGGYHGEFLEELIIEIAKADILSQPDALVKTRPKGLPRMLCNETLDLSIINANDGLLNGLTSLLDSTKKKQEPLLGPISIPGPDSNTCTESKQRPSVSKAAGSPRRKAVGAVRSADGPKRQPIKKPSTKEDVKKKSEKLNFVSDLRKFVPHAERKS